MPTLRDDIFANQPRSNNLLPQEVDALAASGMGDLRRGWESGRIGTELNPLRTQELDAQIAGDEPKRQALRNQIGVLEQRQQMYAPHVGDLRDIHGVGDGLDWAAGQAGQGAASMIDPVAVSAGLGMVGRVAGAVPHPIAKGVGLAATGASMAIPVLMSKNQLTGEFIGEAQHDKELMARTSPQGLRDMAGNYGMAAAIPDSFLPGMVGRQLVGAMARKAGEQALLGAGGKTLMGMGAEGITEGGQAAGSQYARGLLNPNRDTSGDNWDIINNAAGGAVGAGPFSGAGALAESGHSRLNSGVDAVKGKAGEVVDLMNDARNSDTGKKVERSIKDLWESGKGKVGDTIDLAKEKATEFATGEDGSVSVDNAVDNVYTKYEHMRMRKEDKDTLDSGFPEGFTDLPPAQQAAWLVKDDAAKREVIDRVLERSEDPEAKAHMAALQAGTDPAALDNALDFARQITREESTMEVVKDAAESAASWAGELAGKAARGAAGLGVAAAKGAMRGATGKRNAQSAGFSTTSYEDWQARRAAMNPPNTVADGVQDKVNAGIPGTMAEKKAKEDSYRRAVMTGEYLASLVKPNPRIAPKPEMDDFVRQLGYEITDLADSWGIAGRLPKPTDAAAIQRQSPGLSVNLDSLAYEMNGVLGEAAGDALAFIERTMNPKSAPMFEYLRERLISGETTAGRMMRETARNLAKAEMAKLLPRHHFVEVMQAGPHAMDKVFRTFEKLSRGRAKPNDRELVDELLGPETVNKIMELVSGLAVEGKPEKVIEEGVSEFDKAAGEKKLTKGSSAIYGFGAKLAPRTGGDIFARTNTLNEQEKINAAAAGEDITQRPKLFKGTTDKKTGKVTGTDLLPSGDNMLDFKIAEMEKRVGYVRGERTANPSKGEKQEEGWNDTNKGWGVDTISAHDAMEGFGPTRKLALYRDYLRQESSVKEGKTQTPEQQEQAARSAAIGRLLGRIVAHDKKPSGPSSQWTERQNQEWQAALKLAKETGHKGEESMDVSEAALDNHQVKAALAEAEAFFRERHIVRAYSMTDNDPSVLGLDKAMEMEKKAEKIEDSVRLAADKAERRGDDEAANKLRSDANLLYFTRDGKEFPIAVRDLVMWARKAKDYQGQTQDEDDMNRSEASENGRYADAVWAGVSEFAGQHADGMPYKINPAGEKEYFEVGKKGALTAVPDSLMLQNKPFFQARNDGDLSYKFESVLGIRRKHQADNGPNRGRDPEDVRDRASNQRKTNREADKNADFFTAEQREEMDPEVDDRAQKSSATKNKLHRVGDRGYMENGKYIPIDQGRATGGEFGYSTDRSGQVAPEPKISEYDENQNQTPLDFSKGQDPKAEADENTNQSWFTKQTMPRFESPTSAMHGMSSAKHNAAGILRVMMGNQVQEGDGVINGVEGVRANKSIPGMTTYEDAVFNRKTGGAREGDRLVITMLHAALEPTRPKAEMQKRRIGPGNTAESFKTVRVQPRGPHDGLRMKYEAYRIAPLIQLVSNNKEADGKGFREKSNVEYFLQAGATPALVNIVRRGAAQVLIRSETNISDADRLTLARQLLGNEKLTTLGLTKKLQDFLNAEGGVVNGEDMFVNWGDPSLMPADVAMKTQPAPKAAPKTIREKAAAKAAEPAAPREPQAWDLTLDEIDSIGASAQTTTAAKPKPIPESAAAQAAIDRARTATVDDETKRQIRNVAGLDEASKERARVERNKAAGTATQLAAMQAEIARLTALMAKGEQAPATKATPAAPKVSAPAPEGYVVKAPSADLQSKIDKALPKSDGTYLTAIKAAIQRNEMWVASGEAGPNVAKIDIPKLKGWAGMSEAQAKAAVESNNSPNMGRIVKTLQAGGTGNPLGKPSGVPAGVKLIGGAYVAKDNAKSERATKFIGRGSAASSTASYAEQWGALANSGDYHSGDVVFVSAEGKRNGRIDPDAAEIGEAMKAGATILTDSMTTGRERDYNVGERQVAEILRKGGYVESKPGRWTPGSKRNAMATAIHNDLGRRGFAATHDSPHKFDGKFDWRAKQGSGAGEALLGDGTYLSTSEEQHLTYKKSFTAKSSDGKASPTYEVSVDIAQDEILDWRAAMSDQSELVKAAAIKLGMNPGVEALEWDRNDGQWTSYTDDDVEYSIDNQYGSSDLYRDGEHIGSFIGTDVAKAVASFQNNGYAGNGAELYWGVSATKNGSDSLQAVGILGAKSGGTYVIYDDSKITTNYVHFNKQSPDGEHTLASAGEMAAARAWLEKVAPGTILNFIKESGWSGEFIEATNTVNVAIGAAAGILNTTYHEGLHKFFAQFVRSNPQLKAKFDSLVNDPRVRDRIHALLEGYPAAQAQLADGEERLAYAFQFWKAGLLRIDNENRSILQKVGAIFRRVFGMVRDSEHALAIFQAFDEGKLAKPSIAAQVIAKQLGKGTMALRARRGLDGLMQGLGAAVLPAEVILGSNEHSPTARRLGAIMFTNPGKESAGGGQVGYLNAKRAAGKAWANRANTVFENMDEADISAVQKHMQAQTDVADIKMTAHREAVTALRATMKEFHTYLREAGLKIGEVDKYYPVVWSVDALHKNKDKFISMLVEKYPKELNASDGDLTAAAERIHAALIARNGVDNKSLKASREEETGIKEVIREDGVLSPFFAGQEGRILWWLKGKDSEEFQSKSITHTLSQYFRQGVRAAEYRRRFGESGVRLEAMIKEIRAEITNASREVYPLVKNKLSLAPGSMEYVNDQRQIANRNKWVARQMRDISMSVGAIEGTLGKDISPNMRKFTSYMIAYQNVRLLPYMIFSSFVDPLAQVARGAPLNAALETFTYGMREVFRSWADMFRDMPKARQKDEWTKLAEHIGAIEVAMFNHHVADEYSSVYMSPMARKINETLFKMNGMEAWDRANRTMATKWAVRFIEQHAALPDKNHSARWLQELGLSADTVPLNADGQLITTAEELSAVKSISPQLAKIEIAKVHAALNRWVEGAVISPNAAQRPGWSSDPNYASMFHLKQFSYSFQQTIMQRAVAELGHGNLTPITALAGFVPTMLVADIMKGLLQGGGTLPAYIAGMDIGERIGHAVERSGVMGTGDIVGAALQDWSSLGGPAFEQIVDGIRDSSDRTLTKAIPLHAMGEHLFSGRSALEVAGP